MPIFESFSVPHLPTLHPRPPPLHLLLSSLRIPRCLLLHFSPHPPRPPRRPPAHRQHAAHSSIAAASSRKVQPPLTSISETSSLQPEQQHRVIRVCLPREREVLLLLHALGDEIGCFPLGLSLQQLKWNQQQQQRACNAGIALDP